MPCASSSDHGERAGWRRRVGVEVGHRDGGGQRRQCGADVGDLGGAVDGTAAVAVAVDDEQHHGLDLLEAVDDAARAELGRARRPHRAERGGGQERDQGLGDVREVGRHPVAGPHPEGPEARRGPGHLGAQLGPGQLHALARLGVRDHGDGPVVDPSGHEGLGRVVDPAPGEPAGPGHAAAGAVGVAEDPLRRAGGLHAEVVPDRAPERVEVGHRPLPELGVVGEAEPPLPLEPGQVRADAGGGADVGRRTPQHLGFVGERGWAG